MSHDDIAAEIEKQLKAKWDDRAQRIMIAWVKRDALHATLADLVSEALRLAHEEGACSDREAKAHVCKHCGDLTSMPPHKLSDGSVCFAFCSKDTCIDASGIKVTAPAG